MSHPRFIDIDQNKKKLFVSSDRDNKIYVVDIDTNSLEKEIPVENGRPRYVYFDENNNAVYVSNDRSNLVHLINSNNNEILIGVRFQANPPGGGYIQCKELPTDENTNHANNDYALYSINTNLECKSLPKKDFSAISEPSSGDFPLISSNAENKTVTFSLTQFGTLTADFNEIPQWFNLFKEYEQFIYGIIGAVILAPIIGWILPFAVGRKEKKRQLQYLKVHIPLIDNIYNENNQKKDRCLDLLEQQKKEIIEELQEGIINDATFRILNARILGYIYKIVE